MTAKPASSAAGSSRIAGASAADPRVTDGQAIPRHVAVIMDGNGRWAKSRRLPRVAGHKAGMDAVRSVVDAAPKLGIEVLTLYAFSSENWKRPQEEVGFLFGLLKTYLLGEIAELDANDVRVQCIGDWRALPAELVTLLEGAITRTANNRGLTLVLALNYGSRDELVRAVRKAVATNGHDSHAIDADMIDAALDTAHLPAPDLIVRTSGEQRLSNFLLWQSAYAELVFTETLWPDFDGAALADACAAYARRERRYGGL